MKLKSGETVVDRHNSHVHEGIGRFLPEALEKIESKGREFFVEEVDFGRPIGETICVTTGSQDTIVYAKRPGRRGCTRFVLNRTPDECPSLVVILKSIGGGEYVLISAFIGCRPEPEPWDQRNFQQQANSAEAEKKSREFWANHALIYGVEPIIPGTETEKCPW